MSDKAGNRRYKRFKSSISQYMDPKKCIRDLTTIESTIRTILKTHQPIGFVDYQYGFSNSLIERTQIIVHETNERSKVREYFKTETNSWKCCECSRKKPSSSTVPDLILAHGMVFVKIGHGCKPRDFSFVQEIQKLYKEKNIDEAVALQKSVLGSKDFQISDCKQKTAAAQKCRTENARRMINDLSSRYPQVKNGVNIEELRKSNIDESVDEIQEVLTPEASFAKIIENLKEYSTEKAEVVLSNKSKLLWILKRYRPIKIGNYEFGYSANLQKDNRLIVFEWNGRKRVREYSFKSDTKNRWQCRECFRVYQREPQHFGLGPDLYFVNGIVFVGNEHNCAAMNYYLVMHHQMRLRQGKKDVADLMRQKVNFAFGAFNYTNILNILDVLSAAIPGNSILTVSRQVVNGNENNSKTSTNLKRKNKSNDGNVSAPSAEKPLVHEKSKSNKSALDDTVADRDDSVLFVEEFPIRKKPRLGNIVSVIPLDDTSKSQNDTVAHEDVLFAEKLPPQSKSARRRLRRQEKKRNSVVEESDISIDQNLEMFKLNKTNDKIFLKSNLGNVTSISPKNDAKKSHKDTVADEDVVFVEEFPVHKKSKLRQSTSGTLKNDLNKSHDGTVAPDDVSVLFVQEFPCHRKPNLGKIASVIPKDDANKFHDGTVADKHSSPLLAEKLPTLSKSARRRLSRKEKKRNSVGKKSDISIDQNLEINCIEMKESEPESSPKTLIFPVENPLILMVKEICAKLKIEYCRRAEKLWEQIIYDETKSQEAKIQDFKTRNFFEILSVFFTGGINQSGQIQDAIIDAFCDKLISSGEILANNFDEMYLDTVTDVHLSFVAEFLKCDIFICDGSEIRNYGESTSSEQLTLVVAFIDGFYSIVLTL